MDTQGNGLTLEALAHKLETLQQENAERLETLERENAGLRAEVSALRGSDTPRDEVPPLRGSDARRSGEAALAFDGQVSRRSLLSKAGAAAVAAVAAGTLLYPRQAKADHADRFHYIEARSIGVYGGDKLKSLVARNDHGARAVWATTTSDSNAAVWGENEGSGPGVEGIAKAITGTGVEGRTNGSLGTGVSGTGGFIGVDGIGNVGVRGTGTDAQQAGVKGEGPTGVWGRTSKTHFAGVYGEHTGTSGNGVLGIGKGGEQGVFGKNPDNIGVRGDGKNGVYGESTTGNGWSAVVGRSTGRGGIGTYGECSGGIGVKGVSTSGYAGEFVGGKAQLKLQPAGSAGKPTTGTHSKGEIYMDSAGALFVCTASGTPGTWKKVNMKLV